jgi:hypothetical protein
MNDEPIHVWLNVGPNPLVQHGSIYDTSLASLFTEADFLCAKAGLDGREHRYYSSGLDQFRDRLQLRGLTTRRTHEELDNAIRLFNSQFSSPQNYISDPHLSIEEVLDNLSKYVNTPRDFKHALHSPPHHLVTLLGILPTARLALDLIEDTSVQVRYHLALPPEQLRTSQSNPLTDQAREERHSRLVRDAPLVILTEGSSDSRILTEAVSVTHPHLVNFLRFMDFSSGAEGSAASLAKLVRSFIGAGIANRVVAIADNDTAAHDALERLSREHVLDGYRILHYPSLPLLASYPTLGPQSSEPVLMDINGKAGSLEMYLGRDLLINDGQLIPVQWMGFVEGQRSYQGTIAKHHKVRIQEEFYKKARLALRDPGARTRQDWSGTTEIIRAIIHAFD